MFPVQIQFRDIEESDFIWNAILAHAEKLERYFDRIIGCQVVISAPHQRQNQGTIFHVELRLTLPGERVLVNHEREKNHAHEDIYVAIRDAFDSAERRLEDYIRRKRGLVKVSRSQARGRILRIFFNEGYGFIISRDGREIYFHKNSVLGNGFGKLRVGDEVRYSEEMGQKGPQVTSMARTRAASHTLTAAEFEVEKAP